MFVSICKGERQPTVERNHIAHLLSAGSVKSQGWFSFYNITIHKHKQILKSRNSEGMELKPWASCTGTLGMPLSTSLCHYAYKPFTHGTPPTRCVLPLCSFAQHPSTSYTRGWVYQTRWLSQAVRLCRTHSALERTMHALRLTVIRSPVSWWISEGDQCKPCLENLQGNIKLRIPASDSWGCTQLSPEHLSAGWFLSNSTSPVYFRLSYGLRIHCGPKCKRHGQLPDVRWGWGRPGKKTQQVWLPSIAGPHGGRRADSPKSSHPLRSRHILWHVHVYLTYAYTRMHTGVI